MEVEGAPLSGGYHAVRPGDLACIVTALEMREMPAALRRLVPEADVPVQLVRWENPSPEKYRLLYRRVGATWLWWSRLARSDADLTAIIHDPRVRVFAVVDRARVEVGMLELDFRLPGECEIAFFGLIPGATGKGLGKWLMRRALEIAWREPIGQEPVRRVWVHTCTLDDPRAVGFYAAQGFIPYARAIEVFPDPRGAGLLPSDVAPHAPLLPG